MSKEIFLNSNELAYVFWMMALAFALGIASTPVLTHFLYKYKFWKQARTTTITGEKAKIFQALHKKKHSRNVPTMAGVLIWLVVAFLTFAFNLDRAETWLPLFALLAAGMLGLVDDYINVRTNKPGIRGIDAWMKIFWLLLISGVGAWWFHYKLGWDILRVPGLGDLSIGWWYVPLFMLVIIATANAVNITDGLDGLAGGLVTIAFSSYTVIAITQDKIFLAAFCATMTGATLAYTWFNIYPARFFMGDTGSLALGATLGTIAMLTNTAVILIVIGGVFVLEAASSLIQITAKKVFGRKVFKIAPLHHQFEALGWPETKVTMRFWVIGAMFAVIGLMLALFN